MSVIAEQISSVKDIMHCSECGSVREYIATGAVCPEGHGKIHPCDRIVFAQTKREMRKKAAFEALPVAKAIGKRQYTVEGREGLFSRANGKKCKDAGKLTARAGKRRIYLLPA